MHRGGDEERAVGVIGISCSAEDSRRGTHANFREPAEELGARWMSDRTKKDTGRASE